MEPKTYNRYWIRTLLRDELTRVMLRDARNESAWIKEMTMLACMEPDERHSDGLDDTDENFNF
jgi:hypothetical protein